MKGLFFLLFLIITCSCDMQKEVNLDLPSYENQLSVECYLTPGKRYKLSLLESVGYFDKPIPPFVDSAFVTVTHNGIVDTLFFDPQYDESYQKIYNYVSKTIVPEDYTSEFELYVKDKTGRIATAKTIILPSVPIDTVYLRYSNQDSTVAPLSVFYDNLNTKNYYRYIVQKNGIKTATDYQIDDLTSQTSKVELTSDYNIEKGSDIKVVLYHITKEFYDFYKSVEDARNANGNPFGQPSTIKSNINGGIGIFTGLSGDSVSLHVPN